MFSIITQPKLTYDFITGKKLYYAFIISDKNLIPRNELK